MEIDLNHILDTSSKDHPQLLKIWEDSVRATHDFLNEQHIVQIKESIIQHHYFDHVQLFHVERDGKIAGFMGLAYQKVEMLFVDPQFFDQGIGSILIKKAFELGAHEIDVNEQNQRALNFYLKHGFKQIARSELDSEGRPFPILHLRFPTHC
ncbi:GNAT family N-acetyltransferase [Acinetobacter wuhouensis]|uniref:GNAT family N-acetyltransferase n=1 Tax=Acinetobacter wuhouensis TaxID=1879050 RepID=A0A3G2SZ08_9GAMM|nr:GNAT family N-acetyltransferase [Acinetobacter wuhouensis]AYO53094.1 GNAT family N-acetyltransferase [Acinetobacter wuhouensis]